MPRELADEADGPEGRFARLLASLDDAIARGEAAPIAAHLPPRERDRAERARACLCRLAGAWPRLPRCPWGGEAAGPLPPRIGRFEVVRLIGSGGFGYVYLARDPVRRREVAVKVPHLATVSHPEGRARILQEARSAARLAHPNVVALYEVGEIGSVVFLVLEYCPGPTLAAWLRGRPGPLAPAAAAGFLLTLAGVVDHVHRSGVVHRDLKPGNIILAGRGDDGPVDPLAAYTPKVADFGLAHDDAATALAAADARLGTPEYMAPEQAAGRGGDVGPWTDVWALGVIFYELLTGSRPFGDDADGPVLDRVRAADPEAPRRRRPGVPRGLERICLRCLAKDPADRYRSAGQLAEDLRW